MIRTFKETLASLQDKQYGKLIIAKPFPRVLWYWSQYFLLVAAVTLILVLAAVTYFIPQLPRLLRDNLPTAAVQVKSGRLTTTLSQPAVFGSSDFPIIVDTTASTSAELGNVTTGVLVTGDKILFKQDANTTQTQNISDFPDFHTDKNTLVSYVTAHQIRLWLIVVGLLLGFSLLLSAFLWIGRLLGFAIWSLIFWLAALLLKRRLTYLQIFNLVLYASVLPFLMDAFLALAPNQLISFVSLGVFLYFMITWLLALPRADK